MNRYRADLHVHTVLSPCGDLDMSPVNIVDTAARRRIDILGITDHNSTKHGELIKRLAAKEGIFVLCGAEVTTREEIHCLAFFENNDILKEFQEYLDRHMGNVMNQPEIFGYQVVVDEGERIIEEIDRLLISALDESLDDVEKKVHSLGGIFIPAHIDRQSYSLFSQLGFVPPGLKADALEISGWTCTAEILKRFPGLESYSFIGSSDAHHPSQIGSRTSLFEMKTRSFTEIKMALAGDNGRSVTIQE